MGRFEPAGPRRTGRSRPEVAHWQHGGLLSHTLLTLMAALPDAVMRDVAPVFCSARPTVEGDGRVVQSPATAASASGDWLTIDACDAALLERFGTGCTLGEISAWAVDQGLVDVEASWQRTRLLFLRLVAYGLCRPAQSLSEVGG